MKKLGKFLAGAAAVAASAAAVIYYFEKKKAQDFAEDDFDDFDDFEDFEEDLDAADTEEPAVREYVSLHKTEETIPAEDSAANKEAAPAEEI